MEEVRQDFEKYLDSILDVLQPFILRSLKTHRKELEKVVWNDIFDLEGPRAINRSTSTNEKFVFEVFDGARENYESYDNLCDLEVYVGRFPYTGTRISRRRHLTHNIESYFHEMYIMRERLVSYVNRVKKLYKNDKRYEDISTVLEELVVMVKKSLGGVVKLRGSHVHQSRYSDSGLSSLSAMELLIVGQGDVDFEFLHKHKYMSERKRWKNKIEQNNKTVKEMLNMYANCLQDIVFDGKDRLNYPL